jgi:hypothetical protein
MFMPVNIQEIGEKVAVVSHFCLEALLYNVQVHLEDRVSLIMLPDSVLTYADAMIVSSSHCMLW